MFSLFSKILHFRKGVKWAAVGWTLFLFLLCLIPGNELPTVDIPFVDKWVHFILFAVFSFLWLMAFPGLKWQRLLFVFACSVLTGWLVEELQGLLVFLGRFKDVMDIVADAVGGMLGVLLFRIFYAVHVRRNASPL